MKIRFSFRAKLLMIVGTSALTFAILILIGILLTRRMTQQLARIQEHYIPIIELKPRLEADLERIRRGFQDSVASQDLKELKKTSSLKEQLLADLAAATLVIDSAHEAELRDAIQNYYSSAHDLCLRLIAGETGVELVTAMTGMQSKYTNVVNLLEKSMSLDRRQLMTAFSMISETQVTNERILILASVSCLLVVLFLSLGLSHGLLLSLSSLTNGLRRFGKGDFSQPISIANSNELGDVASEANQMAHRIKSLLKELESFSYSVAHDLRAPLRGTMGFSTILLEDYSSSLPLEAKELLNRVIHSTKRMGQLIDSLLNFSRLSRKEIKKEQVSLSGLAESAVADLRTHNPDRVVEIKIEGGLVTRGDPGLLSIVLVNLLGNAWKFTSKKKEACIEFGTQYIKGSKTYFVRDNGAGFDMQYAGKLFGTFQRLHSNEEFEGTGIGLVTVQSIINRHGGEIWADAKLGQGAVFYFTL